MRWCWLGSPPIRPGGVLHITIDDAALDRTAEAAAFFGPKLEDRAFLRVGLPTI